MAAKTPRKANSGSFKPGPDPRRHKFTRTEQRLGYYRALLSNAADWDASAWFYRKIRSYYRQANK